MKELIEKRIADLREAIVKSGANHQGLTGRLLEAEWFLTQMEEAEEGDEGEESEVEIAMHAGEEL